MGILNVTPDSFYEGSRTETEEAIARRVSQIVDQGGSIIDVGAFSTRPGASDVAEEEELRRLSMGLAVVRRLAPDAVVSVDTFRPSVAERCVLDYGVQIVNDISGGNDEMYCTVARLGVGYVLTHNDGSAHSASVDTVAWWLSERLSHLRSLGVADVWLDPGFGFHKTLEENWALLRGLSALVALDAPVLVGVSRKSMIYRALGITPAEALNGTTVAHTLALLQGAQVLRVHDVKEAVEIVRLLSIR